MRELLYVSRVLLFALSLASLSCQGHFPARDGGSGDGDVEGGDGDGDSDAETFQEADVEADDSDTCEPRQETRCFEGDLWWFDSCDQPHELNEACSASYEVCRNDSECCSPEVEIRCDGDVRRSYDSCGNAEQAIEDCSEAEEVCRDGVCCEPRQRSICQDGDSWWVDSCGNSEELREACDDGLDCTTDRCDSDDGICQRVPDCSEAECVAEVEECQCQPVATPLTCGSRVAGSLAPSDVTTNLLTDYGRNCGLDIMSSPLNGREMTYRFSYEGARSQPVSFRVETICMVEHGLFAVALDGSFDPCDPARCVSGQTREPPI